MTGLCGTQLYDRGAGGGSDEFFFAHKVSDYSLNI